MLTIQQALDRNITENIAPVVYFHNQKPDDVAKEVSEYIITSRGGAGGESGGGIHEQLVTLLTNIANAIQSQTAMLPACWVSGFFGSGKSLYAKLLGLSLDGMQLPSNRSLSEALLERDDTPNSSEFRGAWRRLVQLIDPMAVVFDIAAVSRDHESFHLTVFREIQKRLGYSSHESIANYERILEEENSYTQLCELCQKTYNKSWDAVKDTMAASSKFSALYSLMYPNEYPDPLDWFDRHEAEGNLNAKSIREIVTTIESMLQRHAPGKTLFIVVDEVSQYLSSDKKKALDVQTFVEELGARFKGRVWLLVTGQERLIDSAPDSILWKLKDRFPAPFRVHLDRANVKEIVNRRLLKKNPLTVATLTQLVNDPRTMSMLKLSGFNSKEVTSEKVIEYYPLLPSHIELLLNITQGLRNRVTTIQSDSGTVRGVLQTVWDIFNHKGVNLKDKPLGELMTLDMVYDMYQTAIDPDLKPTMTRIQERFHEQPFVLKTAKAIALLEVLPDNQAITPELVASVLYPRLGADSVEPEVKQAINTLGADKLIVEQEKLGWRIQNYAGQEWARERDTIRVPEESISARIHEELKKFVTAKPRLYNTPIGLELWVGPVERLKKDTFPAVSLDFRLVTSASERDETEEWLRKSKESSLEVRFIWVSGEHHELVNLVREYERSSRMIQKYNLSQLDERRSKLLQEEKVRLERIGRDVPHVLRACWYNGVIYHKGAMWRAREAGQTSESAIIAVIESKLESIYPHFKEGNVALSERELEKLAEPGITSPNLKFLDTNGGLGLITMDAGKVTFSVDGTVPFKIKEYFHKHESVTGDKLIEQFTHPPFGYPEMVIKACVIALLRAEFLKILASSGTEITSINDPGAKETLIPVTEFKNSEIWLNKDDDGLNPRDRLTCAVFFRENLHHEVENDLDAIADAVYRYFAPVEQKALEFKNTLASYQFKEIPSLNNLLTSLAACRKDRRVKPTVTALKNNLDTIKAGLAILNELSQSLTEQAILEVVQLRKLHDSYCGQLIEIGFAQEIEPHKQAINKQLTSDMPWIALADSRTPARFILDFYAEQRANLLHRQQQYITAALERIKNREDYNRLTSDQSKRVLQVIRNAEIATTAEEILPSLLFLRNSDQNVQQAELKANELVDQFISETLVETLDIEFLKNRAIATQTELTELLNDFESACMQILNQGKKIRLI